MRVFLTGATGYIGSRLLDAFIRAGHSVTALVRDSGRGRHVARRGAAPLVADLGGGAWGDAVRAHDAWVHAAIESPLRGPDVDRIAIETILAAARAARAPGPFVYTSSLWVIGPAAAAVDETAAAHPLPYSAWRLPHEQLVLDAGRDGLRTAVIRPGIVYGGSRGIVGDLFRDGANGLIRVVGDGSNRWPLVYDRDLADLYLRVIASPDAAGVYHAADERDERVQDIAEAIARSMKTPADIRRIPLDEARAKMGAYADALAMDQVVRSTRSRELGWAPALRSVAGNVPRLFEEWRADHE